MTAFEMQMIQMLMELHTEMSKMTNRLRATMEKINNGEYGMDAQTSWENMQEHAADRELLEINQIRNIEGQGWQCCVHKCAEIAIKAYEVKRMGSRSHIDIPLCQYHDSEERAYEMFGDDSRKPF